MTTLHLPEPSDADIQRLYDLHRSQRDPPDAVAFARAVLKRWGVTVTWAPANPEPTPEPKPMSQALADTLAQQARADRLEQLFLADGRDQPDHPMRGLFTGLHIQAVESNTAASNSCY